MTLIAKGIVRIDTGATHGFQVRVGHNKKRFTKLFSDRKCGGRESAFSRAVAYREKLVAKIDALPENAPRRVLRNYASGPIGVHRTFVRGSSGKKYEIYCAAWNPEPGVHRVKAFSLNKFGEHRAFEMACKLRFEMMKAIHGDRYDVASYMDLYRQKSVVDKRRSNWASSPTFVSPASPGAAESPPRKNPSTLQAVPR